MGLLTCLYKLNSQHQTVEWIGVKMYNSSALLYNKRRIEISDIVIYMSYKYFFLSAVGVRNKDMRRSLGLLVSYIVRSIKFQKNCIDESRSLFCPQCKSPPWFIGI